MFDVYIGDIDLTTVIIFGSILVLIPLQLLMCFKMKKIWVKLLPMAIFLTLIIAFVCMIPIAKGWDGIGYWILAMLSGIMLAACAIGWFIWFVIKMIKKDKQIEVNTYEKDN